MQTVESLTRAVAFEEIEVIVAGHIDDKETGDYLTRMVSSHENIVHLDVKYKTGDSSRKKNAGADRAKAEIVAFIDDDVYVDKKWIGEILRTFADPEVGLISGPSLVPDDIPFAARLAGLALSSPAAGYVAYRYAPGHIDIRPARWSRIIGCNMAYRKSVFQAMGGFDPAFWPGEEMIASYRTEKTGAKLMFNPSAWLYHYPRQSLGKFWRQMWGYGATRIRLVRSGVEFEWTTLMPALWVASLIVLAVVGAFTQWALWLLLLDLLVYALVDAAISVYMATQTKKLKDLALFFVIPLMHLSYGLAEWSELFRPGKDLSETS